MYEPYAGELANDNLRREAGAMLRCKRMASPGRTRVYLFRETIEGQQVAVAFDERAAGE